MPLPWGSAPVRGRLCCAQAAGCGRARPAGGTPHLAGARAAGATRALRGLHPADGHDVKGVHATGRVVVLLLHHARVHHVHDALDCKQGAGPVRGSLVGQGPRGKERGARGAGLWRDTRVSAREARVHLRPA
jgi:hypothetical protein